MRIRHLIETEPADQYDDRVSYELGRLPQSVASAVVRFLAYGPGPTSEELPTGLVDQVLAADEDLTLRALATLAGRLDAHFEVALVPNREPVPPPAPVDRADQPLVASAHS
jgi:hypothetical protein